jgi:hypothetical protein
MAPAEHVRATCWELFGASRAGNEQSASGALAAQMLGDVGAEVIKARELLRQARREDDLE